MTIRRPGTPLLEDGPLSRLGIGRKLNMATKQRDIKAMAEKYAAKYGRKDLETGFEYASLHVLAQQEPYSDSILNGESSDDSDLSDFYCGGKGDLGIDGILFDEGSGCVEIIQVKYHTSTKSSITAEDLKEAKDFFASFPRWSDQSRVEREGNEKVQELLGMVELNGEDVSVTLTFVEAKILGSDQRLHDAAEDATNGFLDRGLNVTCRVIGTSELLDIDTKLKAAKHAGLVESVRFRSSPANSFIFEPPDGLRVLTAAIKGNEIADLYHQSGVGPKLFNTNIRLALQSGKINPKIAETLNDQDEASNFFYYNNGVTATCSHFDFDPRTGEVNAEMLQVVNGAQTVSNLQKVLKKKPNPHVYVLLRLIETGESGKYKSSLADNITKFQNTQNPVRDSDFLSNEPFQLWLRDNLAQTLSGRGACIAFWYCHKRGYVAKDSKHKKRIGMEELGMLRHSVFNGPSVSYSSPKKLWDLSSGEIGSAYWSAFGRDGDACTSWTKEELFQVAWMLTLSSRLERQHKELMMKKKAGDPGTPETGFLKYLSRYIVALVASGIHTLQAQDRLPTYEEIMSHENNFEKFTAPLTKIARRLVREQMARLRESTAADPRHKLGRSPEMWDLLKVRLMEEIEGEELFTIS